jgi:hypothetical protein
MSTLYVDYFLATTLSDKKYPAGSTFALWVIA